MSRHIRYIFLYMLEPQYIAIYTCCDKVKLGAERAESIQLVSLPFRFHITPPELREPYKTSLWEELFGLTNILLGPFRAQYIIDTSGSAHIRSRPRKTGNEKKIV